MADSHSGFPGESALSKAKASTHTPPPTAWTVTLLALVGLAVGWAGCHSPGGIGAGASESAWLPVQPSDRWQCLVIHHSASDIGGAERFDQWHRARGWDELGYHFVIGNGTDTADGQVEVGPRWMEQKHGAHCKTPDGYYNQHGIGICLVGNLDNYPPTPAQLRSLTRLTRFLCREFHIPASRIYTHGGITGKTDCPGKFFDLQDLRRRASAVSSSSHS